MNISGWDQDRSRRDVLRFGAATIGAVAVGSTLAACSSGGDKSSSGASGAAFSTGPEKGKAKKGGTLSVGMIGAGAAESINVKTSFQNVDQARILSLYDLMFNIGPSGTVTPGLIEEATPNADATVWNFRVRSDVVWHDGKPLTADDIVWTIKSSWGDPANLFNIVLGKLIDFAGVRKVGPLDVTVPLKRGVATLPTLSAFYTCAVIQDGTKTFDKFVGTGPFKFVSFAPGKTSVFVANTNYWRPDAANVDKLVIDSSFSAESARMDALLSGSLDVLPAANPALVRANATGNKIIVGNQPGPAFMTVSMRVDQGPLKDPKIRQALKLIPDRQKYVDTVLSGYGTLGNDLGGATLQYFADDLKGEHDPDRARSMLKSAGAEGLQITLDTSATISGQNEMATLYAQQAKRAGVDVKVTRADPASYYTPAGGYQTRPFSTNYYTTGINSLATFYLLGLVTGGPYNDTHWGSPADDALLYDALGELDDAKATQKWEEVQKAQVDRGGYIIPQNINWLDAYAPKVRGLQTTKAMNCNNFDFGSAWIAK
jgi:peptide/nickel transport system substrate-binding protein